MSKYSCSLVAGSKWKADIWEYTILSDPEIRMDPHGWFDGIERCYLWSREVIVNGEHIGDFYFLPTKFSLNE